MAEVSILCGLDVGQQAIARGVFSRIVPPGYEALLPPGSFTFTRDQVRGVSYPPILVKAVIEVLLQLLPIAQAGMWKPPRILSWEITEIRNRS